MIFPIVATVTREPFTAGAVDDLGMPVDGWSPAVSVDSHGWWPPSAESANGDIGRRSITCDLVLLVPTGTVCGDRDRWTLPGEGSLEQQGDDDDYNHGPFGAVVPQVVYLKRVAG